MNSLRLKKVITYGRRATNPLILYFLLSLEAKTSPIQFPAPYCLVRSLYNTITI